MRGRGYKERTHFYINPEPLNAFSPKFILSLNRHVYVSDTVRIPCALFFWLTSSALVLISARDSTVNTFSIWLTSRNSLIPSSDHQNYFLNFDRSDATI